MCHRLFIASNHSLPLIAPIEAGNTFSAEDISADVRAILPFPQGWQVVEAGSTSGCACDFFGDDPVCRRFLAGYLRQAATTQSVLVYSTWYNDETDPHDLRPAIAVDALLIDDDPFPYQTLTPVK